MKIIRIQHIAALLFTLICGFSYSQSIHSKTIIFSNDPRIKMDYDSLHKVTRYLLDTSLLKTGTLQIESCEKKRNCHYLMCAEIFIYQGVIYSEKYFDDEHVASYSLDFFEGGYDYTQYVDGNMAYSRVYLYEEGLIKFYVYHANETTALKVYYQGDKVKSFLARDGLGQVLSKSDLIDGTGWCSFYDSYGNLRVSLYLESYKIISVDLFSEWNYQRFIGTFEPIEIWRINYTEIPELISGKIISFNIDGTILKEIERHSQNPTEE